MKLRLDKDGAVGSSSLKLKCHWNQTHDQRLIKQLQISFFCNLHRSGKLSGEIFEKWKGYNWK